MIKKNKNMLFIVGIICLMISAICFVSYSNTDIQEVIIKSITPIYDENDTYSVGNTGVIFNDKDQVVKYNIVVENTRDYDVKITDLQLSTPTEEFLKYTVENVELDDVIKANETKELVVSFETIKMDGWGRNFNDELVTTLVFDEVKKQEEVVTPPVVDTKPNTNVPTNKVENNNSVNNVQPEVDEPVVNEPVIEQPKDEVNNNVVTTPEDDANHELGMNQEIIVKDAHPEDVVVIYCFGIATGVLGIGLVMVNKNKFTKYIVLFIVVGSTVRLASANEIMSLEIPINISYESQNVMIANGCVLDEGMYCSADFWQQHGWYLGKVKNFYIQNELIEVNDYVKKSDVSEKQDGRVIAYIVESQEDSTYYDAYLQADGIIYANEDASYYFADMRELEKIHNLEGFDTSNVTDMSSMFKLTGLNCENFTLDLSSFDTSNVTDMGSMFYETGYSNPNFTLDLSSFDTSNVTDMSGMFYITGYNNPNFTLDLSNFDTSNVTDMSSMFYETGYSNPNFTLDLSNFDTSNATDMRWMFYRTGYNNPNFTLDLSNFDTSNVTDMSYMFNETGYNSTNFTLDVSNFDTSKVTNMSYMFNVTGYNSTNFTLDVSNFDTSKVTNMSYMFNETGYNSTNFTLDVSNFDTSNVTNMYKMFFNTGYNSTMLNTSITIRNKDLASNFYSYEDMFKNAAIQPGSKITVNYTTETKWTVDKIIATKSSNSNVVKGIQVD